MVHDIITNKSTGSVFFIFPLFFRSFWQRNLLFVCFLIVLQSAAKAPLFIAFVVSDRQRLPPVQFDFRFFCCWHVIFLFHKYSWNQIVSLMIIIWIDLFLLISSLFCLFKRQLNQLVSSNRFCFFSSNLSIVYIPTTHSDSCSIDTSFANRLAS